MFMETFFIDWMVLPIAKDSYSFFLVLCLNFKTKRSTKYFRSKQAVATVNQTKGPVAVFYSLLRSYVNLFF